MGAEFVDPLTGEPLKLAGDSLVGDRGERFPVIDGIPRFCPAENYATSFGKQWNRFEKTQIDREGTASDVSSDRLFRETGWTRQELDGLDILEVGSGAGRFSRAILQHTAANLYSIDYSNAVEANRRNNGDLGRGRFWLAQASIYEMPFPDDLFDKVLCLGVLQHTPDFEKSVASLIAKARPGGEIVVDFYPIRGWWTKIHAKYLLRPITKRMNHETLLRLIERNVEWMIKASDLMSRAGMVALTRFLPLVDQRTLPSRLSETQRREWTVLDTFDMFSPVYDNPQRLDSVVRMFERHGARVCFAQFIESANRAAVVRAIKMPKRG